MIHLFSFNGPFNTVLSLTAILIIAVYSIKTVIKFRGFIKEPSGAPRFKKFGEGVGKIILCLVFLVILSALATIRDQQNTSKAKEYLYLTPDVIPGIKNVLMDSMSRRDTKIVSSIDAKLANFTTFGDVYGFDSTGEDLKPMYIYQTSMEYEVDTAGNLTLDTNYVPKNVTAVIPAAYLASTGGKLYTKEWKRDTVVSESGNYATIVITYQLVTTTSTVAKPIAEKPQQQIAKKTSEYKSEDQKAIEEGLKSGSLIRLPNGDVVIKPADEPQKKVEASKKPTRKYRF